MSLLDFVSDMGRNLFDTDKDTDAADKIKQHIESQNPGIENLVVECTNGFVTLTGNCSTYDTAEKAALMAGNVKGVARVVNTIDVIEDEPSTKTNLYTIVSGDTLSGIAKRVYGDPMQYPKIFEANREVIQDPNKIFVGQVIRIPA